MYKKHMFVLIAVVVVLSMLIGACGPAPTPKTVEKVVTREVEKTVVMTKEVEKPIVVTATPKPQPKGARKEVRFLFQENDPPSVKAYLSMEKQFEKEYPQYDVVMELTNPDSVGVKISSVIASGGTLDVFQPDPAMAAKLAVDGSLLPIDKVVDDFGGRGKFFPNTLLIVNDHAYCMPYASGGPVLWYRKDLFDAAGLKPPTTWEEMEKDAAALNSDKVAGVILPAGENLFTTIIDEMFMWQAGTQVFDKDGNVQLAGNKRAAEALKHYATLLKYAPKGATSYSFFESIDAFTSGKGAMLIYWGRVLKRLYDNAPDLVGKVGVVPLPKDRMRATFMDISYNCIYKGSKNPDGSLAWLEFMARPEQAVKIQLTVPGHLAPVTEAQEEALMKSGSKPLKENPDIAKVLFGINDYAYNVFANRGGIDEKNLKIVNTGIPNSQLSTLWSSNVLARAVQKVFLKGEDPAKALEEAQKELEEALKVAK